MIEFLKMAACGPKLPNFAKIVRMPRQTVRKQENKRKPKAGRFRLANIFYILLAFVVLSSFLFFNFFYTPKRNRPVEKPVAAARAGIPFTKEGQVTILRENNSPLTIDVEIAENEEERLQGLMYRYSMEANQGMFFIFPQEEIRSFWMKNTFISLDIIYINSNYEIVSIQKYTQPKSTYSLPSEGPSQYVLEVIAGFTDQYGVGPGQKVELKKLP